MLASKGSKRGRKHHKIREINPLFVLRRGTERDLEIKHAVFYLPWRQNPVDWIGMGLDERRHRELSFASFTCKGTNMKPTTPKNTKKK